MYPVINSNMTNTKKDFYVFFKHFKRVILLASVDGVGGMQEYLDQYQLDTNFK
jgi:hypothetical protein